ncbi:MAG: bifunctional ornithine acetyltransferase/N-acetylglutamate synthase, partial [Candidatus Methanoplasma sp.]|nr:bifunctional ornithine acetyltransferase/N-acetylglutamate synthase [Candidatus Methanoplasma sp.]
MVEIIEGGVTTPQGFKAAGVHSGVKYRALDLGLLYSEVPATAFVGYTSNAVKAAPVQVMMKENAQKLSAVVINSGNANALTGRRGLEDAMSMKQAVAAELEIDPVSVGVMSTGLIGRFMDMHKVRYGISRATRELDIGREADALLAEAIMTTDTIKKECAVRVRLSDGTLVYIGAISKGSGMIAPHLKVLHGTTLTLVTTDASLSPRFRGEWQDILD